MEQKTDILIKRFLEAASRYGDRPALEKGSVKLTYRELLSISSRIARKVMEVSDLNSPVAILSGKNINAYAGILAALLAGRAYVPLNPRFPLARNIKMINGSGSTCLILDEGSMHKRDEIKENTEREIAFVLPGHDRLPGAGVNMAEVRLPDGLNSQDIAYIMFTSGTTGEPKGVPVTNRSVCSYLDHMSGSYDFNPSDRFSQTFDLTFDLSVHDLFLCWINGACLCIPDKETPFFYPKYLVEMEVSVWFSVPSLAVLMDKMHLLRPGSFPRLRLSFFCGEPLLKKTIAAWEKAAPASRIINLYGPSETTIAISSYEWKPDQKKDWNGIASIGKVFPGHKYVLLDDDDKKVEMGEQGFLHIKGKQVIGGYLDEKDNQHSFKELGEGDMECWYNTGDLVAEDAEGDLFFLGRADHEVKISGYRVNLLAIDDTFRRLSGIGQVATIAVTGDGTGSPALVVFLEGSSGQINEQDLLSFCRNELPWYMVPQRFVVIERLPLNENGKIDRKKLNDFL